MRMLVSKVSYAKLYVDHKLISEINQGYIVYLGVHRNDDEKIVLKCVDKLLKLRIFHDENDKLNIKLDPHKHEILVVSQFTLYGDVTRHNRPSFTNAAEPTLAKNLYERFVSHIQSKGYPVKTGVFGAHMEIDARYKGPFNLCYELEAGDET